MTDQKAVDRYGLLAFDLLRRRGGVGADEYLRRADLGRSSLSGLEGKQWAVCLVIGSTRGAAERRVLYPVGCSAEEGVGVVLAQVRVAAVTGDLAEGGPGGGR